MGARNNFHSCIKSTRKPAPSTVPDAVVYVDVSVLMHSINRRYPSLAANISVSTPSTPSLQRLVDEYAQRLTTSHSQYTAGRNVTFVFEGEAKKPVTEKRTRRSASNRNFAYRHRFLAPSSRTTMAAAEKKLANCMGRPPLWFVQMVIQVMKRNGLQV
jgi:hypothetical protein